MRSLPSRAPARAPGCARPRSEGACASGKGESDPRARRLLEELSAKVEADGGSTGGWPEDDHGLFLRALTKFKRKVGDPLMAELRQLLPHRTQEELAAHVSWHERYEESRMEKRNLLEQWRTTRASATCSRSASQAELLAPEPEQQPQRSTKSKQESEQMRRVVSEWRHSQDEAMKAKEEQLQHQRREAAEQEALRRQQRREQCRKELEEFNLRRQAEEEQLRGASDRGASASAGERRLLPGDKNRIARRNSELLERRNSQLQARRVQQEKHAFAPPARSPSYAHVDSRLQSHTEAYVDRAREYKAESAELDAGVSKYSPVPGSFAHQAVVRTVRACPAWRQGFGV